MLKYSVKNDAVFCAPCSIFSKAKGAFICEPCCDWSNFEKQAQRHIETKNHLDAMEAAKIFLKICPGEKKSVKQHLSQAYETKVNRN